MYCRRDEPTSSASTGSEHPLALRCRRRSDAREEALAGHPQALQRYALAVASHLGLIGAWYLFVKLGEDAEFVMPPPHDTGYALPVPNYCRPGRIAVTTTQIFSGQICCA